MLYKNMGKRISDIILASLAFILLSPLLILVAVLIKIFDPGPIVFSQNRVGRFGHDFNFYKFRSMPVNTKNLPSDQIGQVKLTWIGKLIRRTSIDELPQLMNIIKGEMSLVGPRPPLPSQLELVEYRRQSGALNVYPGLTGLAQVNSFDGMSDKQKAGFDALYVAKITMAADLIIMFKTILYFFKKPPIY